MTLPITSPERFAAMSSTTCFSSVEMKVNHGKYLATSQVASALIIIQCSITREETIFHQYSEQYYHNAQFVLIPDSEVYDAVASLAALGKSRLAIATIILKKLGQRSILPRANEGYVTFNRWEAVQR